MKLSLIVSTLTFGLIVHSLPITQSTIGIKDSPAKLSRSTTIRPGSTTSTVSTRPVKTPVVQPRNGVASSAKVANGKVSTKAQGIVAAKSGPSPATEGDVAIANREVDNAASPVRIAAKRTQAKPKKGSTGSSTDLTSNEVLSQVVPGKESNAVLAKEFTVVRGKNSSVIPAKKASVIPTATASRLPVPSSNTQKLSPTVASGSVNLSGQQQSESSLTNTTSVGKSQTKVSEDSIKNQTSSPKPTAKAAPSVQNTTNLSKKPLGAKNATASSKPAPSKNSSSAAQISSPLSSASSQNGASAAGLNQTGNTLQLGGASVGDQSSSANIAKNNQTIAPGASQNATNATAPAKETVEQFCKGKDKDCKAAMTSCNKTKPFDECKGQFENVLKLHKDAEEFCKKKSQRCRNLYKECASKPDADINNCKKNITNTIKEGEAFFNNAGGFLSNPNSATSQLANNIIPAGAPASTSDGAMPINNDVPLEDPLSAAEMLKEGNNRVVNLGKNRNVTINGFSEKMGAIIERNVRQSRNFSEKVLESIKKKGVEAEEYKKYFNGADVNKVSRMLARLVRLPKMTILPGRNAAGILATATTRQGSTDGSGIVRVNINGPYLKVSEDERMVTIAHETSHLFGTDDVKLPSGETAYGDSNSRRLKQLTPQKAADNADNYGYFVRDNGAKNGISLAAAGAGSNSTSPKGQSKTDSASKVTAAPKAKEFVPGAEKSFANAIEELLL